MKSAAAIVAGFIALASLAGCGNVKEATPEEQARKRFEEIKRRRQLEEAAKRKTDDEAPKRLDSKTRDGMRKQ